MSARTAKEERLPTATTVLDDLCRLQLGKPLDECELGFPHPAPLLRALDELRDALALIGKQPETLEFFDEQDEFDCDRIIAAMTRTGSLDPFRFIPTDGQQMVIMTIELAKNMFTTPLLAKRRLRDVPAGLTGHNLGLAALAVYVLRP